jgi:hypothetical protein
MGIRVLESDTMATGTAGDDQVSCRHGVTLGPGFAGQIAGCGPYGVIDRKAWKVGRKLFHDMSLPFTPRSVPQFQLDECTPSCFSGFQQNLHAGRYHRVAVGAKAVDPS